MFVIAWSSSINLSLLEYLIDESLAGKVQHFNVLHYQLTGASSLGLNGGKMEQVKVSGLTPSYSIKMDATSSRRSGLLVSCDTPSSINVEQVKACGLTPSSFMQMDATSSRRPRLGPLIPCDTISSFIKMEQVQTSSLTPSSFIDMDATSSRRPRPDLLTPCDTPRSFIKTEQVKASGLTPCSFFHMDATSSRGSRPGLLTPATLPVPSSRRNNWKYLLWFQVPSLRWMQLHHGDLDLAC